jgi:hypothetical protein
MVAYSFLPAAQPPSGPVAQALVSAPSSDRAVVRGIYTALADVTERDKGSQIGSTAIWRDVHSAALRLAAGEIKGKYAGLDLAVEKVLDEHFSLDNVPMTAEVVAKVVAGCKEVAKQSE